MKREAFLPKRTRGRELIHCESTLHLLGQTGSAQMRDIARWFHENRTLHEAVDVHHWMDTLWYIDVVDGRVKDSIRKRIFALTIDVESDSIAWSNQPHPKNPHGGNCIVRSERWARLLRKKIPDVTIKHDGMVRDYRKTSRVNADGTLR